MAVAATWHHLRPVGCWESTSKPLLPHMQRAESKRGQSDSRCSDHGPTRPTCFHSARGAQTLEQLLETPALPHIRTNRLGLLSEQALNYPSKLVHRAHARADVLGLEVLEGLRAQLERGERLCSETGCG